MIWLLLIFFLQLSHCLGQDSVPSKRDKTVACFWETLDAFPRFTFENLDPSLCSRVIYSYNVDNVTSDHINTTDWTLAHRNKNFDLELGGFRNISQMKLTSPHLTVEYAIGSWQTHQAFYQLASTPAKEQCCFLEEAWLRRPAAELGRPC